MLIMGVHWQDNSYYAALKDYEKDAGTSLAQRNALENPYGNHSTLGVLGVSLFSGVTNLAIKKWGSGLGGNDTGSETDVNSTKNFKSTVGRALANFDSALSKNNSSDVDKYLQELKTLADDNPNDRQVQKAYENALNKKNKTTA